MVIFHSSLYVYQAGYISILQRAARNLGIPSESLFVVWASPTSAALTRVPLLGTRKHRCRTEKVAEKNDGFNGRYNELANGSENGVEKLLTYNCGATSCI